MEWVKTKNYKPKHGQHVNVYLSHSNSYMFDNQILTGDAWFVDQKEEWDLESPEYRARWKDFNHFIELNGPRFLWKGQGPCSFNDKDVTHWQPIEPPQDKGKG